MKKRQRKKALSKTIKGIKIEYSKCLNNNSILNDECRICDADLRGSKGLRGRTY